MKQIHIYCATRNPRGEHVHAVNLRDANESLNLELGPIWIDGNCTDTLRAVVSQGRTLRYERRETIASSRLIL